MASPSETKEKAGPSARPPDQIDPKIAMLTRLLDDFIRIPGTNIGLGLDGLIGMLPVVGDLVTAAFGYWMLQEAKRLGLPPNERAKIVVHYAMDILVGFVPFVGDVLDFAYKANRRSLTIIERFLEERARIEQQGALVPKDAAEEARTQ